MIKKLILTLLIVLTAFTLTACEEPEVEEPPQEEYQTLCIAQDNFLFYESTIETMLGNKDVHMMITPHGDVEIPTGIYEDAIDWEYQALCYRTLNGIAETYLSARKAETKPEPIIEVITETVEVIKEVEVYTHAVVETMPELFVQDAPGAIYLDTNLAWIYFPIRNNNIEGEEFQEGDFLLITYVANIRTFQPNQLWKASATHYRLGIALKTVTTPEEYITIGDNTLEEYITGVFENPSNLESVYTELYEFLYPSTE